MINIPDIVGWTSFHIACYYKRPDVMLLLLKNGANLFTRDREGITPIDLVFENEECLKVINAFMAFNIQNESDYDNTYEYEKTISYNTRKNTLKKPYYRTLNKEANHSQININVYDDEEEEKTKQILEHYKYIPKKHKFYYSYNNNTYDYYIYYDGNLDRYKDKIQTTHENDYIKFNTLKKMRSESETIAYDKPKKPNIDNLIKIPKIFPKVKPFEKIKNPLGFLDDSFNEEYKSNVIHKSTALRSARYINIMEESLNYSNDESLNIDDLNLDDRMNLFPLSRRKFSLNKNANMSCDLIIDQTKSMDNEDTVSINFEDSFYFSEKLPFYVNINDNIVLNSINTKIIDIPETEYFMDQIKIGEIFHKFFELDNKMIEDILCFIFEYDHNVGLLFLLNIFNCENNHGKLVNFLRKELTNKYLLGLIISQNYNFENGRILNISNIYFNSFEYHKLSLNDCIKKSLKCKIL
jgi:hypothetical protein